MDNGIYAVEEKCVIKLFKQSLCDPFDKDSFRSQITISKDKLPEFEKLLKEDGYIKYTNIDEKGAIDCPISAKVIGHKVIFSALVGSHNYNLNDEKSDKDYKYFVLPTLDDLYDGIKYSKAVTGEDVDYTVHDVRKLTELFWKANINFLEILFSTETTGDALRELFMIRDDIVTMNMPYLYNACKGMYFEKMKNLQRGTATTQDLVTKFGYDTKQAMHAYRVLDFCTRFHGDNFGGAIWYKKAERDFLLAMKRGEFTQKAIKDIISNKFKEFTLLESWYKEQKPNEETKNTVYNIVKNVVKKGLL